MDGAKWENFRIYRYEFSFKKLRKLNVNTTKVTAGKFDTSYYS